MSIVRSFVVLILLLAIGAEDASAEIPCTPGATIRFLNGVFKDDEQDVARSADLLRERLVDQNVRCIAEVTYLYNPSEGLPDLKEAAIQKVSELGIQFSEAILIVAGGLYGNLPFGIASRLPDSEVEALRRRVVAFMQRVSLSTYAFTVDGRTYTTGRLVNDFRDKIILDLSRGTEVIIVAHSQGNLFANEANIAVRGASPPNLSRGLAIVNVANAANSAPSDLYLTSFEDVIIGLFTPFAMVPNVSAGFTVADITGHGFREIYLSLDLPSGASSQNSMAGRVGSLVQQALNVTPSPSGSIIGSTFTSLVRIDLETLTAQLLGSFSTGSGGLTPVYDIAINPRGGPAAAISPSALSTFDPSVRLLTRLPQSSIVNGNALAFNGDGELFGMSGSAFYKIDPSTGATDGPPLSIGAAYTTSGDLTFDSDGSLFGTAIGPSGRDYLIKIDTLRRSVTPIGDTGFSEIWGLYFSGGVLYGATSNGTLISINRSTGQGTLVATLNMGNISGLQ